MDTFRSIARPFSTRMDGCLWMWLPLHGTGQLWVRKQHHRLTHFSKIWMGMSGFDFLCMGTDAARYSVLSKLIGIIHQILGMDL